jgi:hypothetical protein
MIYNSEINYAFFEFFRQRTLIENFEISLYEQNKRTRNFVTTLGGGGVVLRAETTANLGLFFFPANLNVVGDVPGTVTFLTFALRTKQTNTIF